MNFILGELFCGPGGMAFGAKLSEPQVSAKREEFSISHAWGVDHDVHAIATYNANEMGEGIHCDALVFAKGNKTAKHKTIKDFRPITALAFGFPCNDFSMVGKRKGTKGIYGTLYKAGIKAINRTNPLWFVAENVSGIHSANAGKAFKQILRELKKAGEHGYRLTVHLYRFEDYGVPQSRHRYIIVGIRGDQSVDFKVPAPTHRDSHVTVREALTKPYAENVSGREFTRQGTRIVERLKFTPPWENAWFLDELHEMSPPARRLILSGLPWWASEFEGIPDAILKKRIDACRLKCKKARMSHIYRRLHPDKPSYTITGSGGGGTHVYHWEEHRALTNRERARLQGFDDTFQYEGSKEQVRKQIGMAVPPLGAKIIFEAILKTFAGIEYPCVEPSLPGKL